MDGHAGRGFAGGAALYDFLVLGAGVSGLACAGALAREGAVVAALDKGRGVGGRAATRRLDGQPVDHGVPFLHGRDPGFLAALDAVPATRVEGWPTRISGTGPPCNPAAFDGRRPARRLAFAEGLTALPKALAAGLDLRTGRRARRLDREGAGWSVEDEAGELHRASALVLALPVEQAAALLPPSEELSSTRALLGLVSTRPCLALIAAYEGPDDPLEAELWLPEASEVLQLVSHDSSKRPQPRRRVLVLQARPAWSAARLEAPEQELVSALLAEAARLLGPWAASPALVQLHRWRYARVQSGDTFLAPYLTTLPGGARLGLCGEAFHPDAGVEGAFLAGQRLAHLLLRGVEHA